MDITLEDWQKEISSYISPYHRKRDFTEKEEKMVYMAIKAGIGASNMCKLVKDKFGIELQDSSMKVRMNKIQSKYDN